MFEHLKTWDKILVTGPQRSGTTICAKMISVDTGHYFLSEAHLSGEATFEAQKKQLRNILQNHQTPFVIQCPSLCRWIHEFTLDTLIVFMMRKVSDILVSEKRIGWDDTIQRELYREVLDKDLPPTAAGAKYLFWLVAQKKVIRNKLEIEYEQLSNHPLWVPAEKRINFSHRQISEDNRFAHEVNPF